MLEDTRKASLTRAQPVWNALKDAFHRAAVMKLATILMAKGKDTSQNLLGGLVSSQISIRACLRMLSTNSRSDEIAIPQNQLPNCFMDALALSARTTLTPEPNSCDLLHACLPYRVRFCLLVRYPTLFRGTYWPIRSTTPTPAAPTASTTSTMTANVSIGGVAFKKLNASVSNPISVSIYSKRERRNMDPCDQVALLPAATKSLPNGQKFTQPPMDNSDPKQLQSFSKFF